MNLSRNETVSTDLNNAYIALAYTIFIILVYPFYVYWALYFLNEVIFVRRKIRGLLHRTPTLETINEIFKYTGNYYTYILVIVIALLEPISLIPAILSLLPFTWETGESANLHSSDMKALAFISCMAVVTLYNLLTTHLIRVCKSDTRVQLLPPIHNKLAILTLVILLLILLKLLLIDIPAVLILANIFSSYESFYLFKHSKQLYRMLKWRYQDMRYEEDYNLYRVHRRIALRYKYFNIPFLSALILLIVSGWLNTPVTGYDTLIPYNYPNVAQKLDEAMHVIEWAIRGLSVIGFLSSLVVPLYPMYNLVAFCLHKIGSPLGRNRIRFEPLLQH